MSFQGDVAGIGLGELLQSLARGGQDGVLRLFGPELSAVLGVRGGMLFLLPGPDEDDDELRLRCQRAWCDDPDPQLENKRRQAIAQASRLEALYALINSSNVHFRFEPGLVPIPEVVGTDGLPTAHMAAGLSVEYVLLEHARLSDESQEGGCNLTAYDIPRVLDIRLAPERQQPFAEHCTGRSTMRELSDRLGWTLLQSQVEVHHLVRAGIVRMGEPRELLVAAQYELTQKRVKRGVDRLTGWILLTPPGPPLQGDADLILTEWNEGDLSTLLGELRPRVGRALLRKLDLADPNRDACVKRWEALRHAHRRDNVAAVHLAAFKLDDGGTAQSTAISDLMRLIRAFEEDGKVLRARALLRLASAEVPDSHKARTDLAMQMLEMGMQDEGIEWLLDAARDLIDRKRGELAFGPLREVLREVPGMPEARDMLEEAQRQGLRRRRRKVHAMIGTATMMLLGTVAAVQYNSRREYERKLGLVHDASADPRSALAILADNFPQDDSPRVLALREQLKEKKANLETQLHSDWMAEFEATRLETETGEPLAGLEAALTLPAPPQLDGPHAPFPVRSELLNLLANRLEELTKEVDPAVDASESELAAEGRVAALLGDVLKRSTRDLGDADIEAFHLRVNEIRGALAFRTEERANLRAAIDQRELEEQQDLLLAAARTHAKNGDLEKAKAAFERLGLLDDSEELGPLLAEETGSVRDQLAAIERARELATSGEHESALEELTENTKKPNYHALPWMARTLPEGVTLELSDGRLFTTPCVVETRLGEELTLEFTLPGHEPQTIEVDRPSDIDLHMHRLPDREWFAGHRVDAAPVPVGNGHIVADRFGRLMRLDDDGRPAWSRELETLAGIARTPVFLPENPTYLLVLSEDSHVWLVDATTGDAQGPWIHEDATPVEGPTRTRHGVSVRFSDGQIALWDDALEPAIYDAVTTFSEQVGGVTRNDTLPSNITVLRRSPENPTRCPSPWTDWTVEALDGEYSVSLDGAAEPIFTVRREGDWSYMGWEAPNAMIPDGRLWISDDGGVRCFRPAPGVMARQTDR